MEILIPSRHFAMSRQIVSLPSPFISLSICCPLIITAFKWTSNKQTFSKSSHGFTQFLQTKCARKMSQVWPRRRPCSYCLHFGVATAQIRPRLPPFWGLHISLSLSLSLTYTHIDGTTPLDEWSDRRSGSYLHNTQLKSEKKHSCPGWIRTRDHSNRAAANLRLRPRGHRDRPYLISYH